MKAVILAGGEGTRLRPLTCTAPKPMVPLLNRPFLEHLLLRLRRSGVDQATLALCYLPDRIQEHLGDGASLGIGLTYAVEEQPLGTAGAVKNVEASLTDGPFFVLNGDILTDLDLQEMLTFHRRNRAMATLFLTPVEDPTAYGVVEMDSHRQVVRFLEKPPRDQVTSPWINGGIYILEPQVLELVPKDTFCMFERGLFPRLLELDYPVFGYTARPYWIDVGNPQAYLRVHHDLLRRGVDLPLLGEDHGDGVWRGPGCRIHPTAVLEGPVVLGEGCSVGPRATLVGPTVLGPGCTIAGGGRVEGSVLWARVRVERGASLKGCVVANDVTVEEEALVGEGCVVGEGTVVGRGNRVERGTTLEPGTRLAPTGSLPLHS